MFIVLSCIQTIPGGISSTKIQLVGFLLRKDDSNHSLAIIRNSKKYHILVSIYKPLLQFSPAFVSLVLGGGACVSGDQRTLRYTALFYTTQHCTVMQCKPLSSPLMFCAEMQCPEMNCTVLHCCTDPIS